MLILEIPKASPTRTRHGLPLAFGSATESERTRKRPTQHISLASPCGDQYYTGPMNYAVATPFQPHPAGQG